MRDTDYAFCVARLRAKETDLLSENFINSLVDAADYNEAVRMLCENSWMEPGMSYKDAVSVQSRDLWQLLNECVPDKAALKSLCILNDYFNIKAAVKCSLSGLDADDYFVYPTTLDLSDIRQHINAHDFSALPSELVECTSKAYDIANKTENGQMADIIIDKAALQALKTLSEKTKNKIFSSVCAFILDTTNIKIALRCAATSKSDDFVRSAISEAAYIDADKLINYAVNDKEELYSYLLQSRYSQGVKLYKESAFEFEKWCDDNVIEIVKGAKYTAFGFGPVFAYYQAKTTEIKNIRIILASLNSGIRSQDIRERLRIVYA